MGVNPYKGEIISMYIGKRPSIKRGKLLVLMKHAKFNMLNETSYMQCLHNIFENLLLQISAEIIFF